VNEACMVMILLFVVGTYAVWMRVSDARVSDAGTDLATFARGRTVSRRAQSRPVYPAHPIPSQRWGKFPDADDASRRAV
jgi:hypothetical protein